MKALIITLTLLFGSSAFSAHHEEEQKTKSPYSKSAWIKLAMAAGPSSISANATIKDYDGTMPRNGTSDWVCMTGSDAQRINPTCLDEEWSKFFDRFMSGESNDIEKQNQRNANGGEAATYREAKPCEPDLKK